MNKMRRKELAKVINMLEEVQNKEDLYLIINELEDIKDDEQDYYDNIPENLQYSQRAEDSEKSIDNMDVALDLLNEVYDMDEFDNNSEQMKEAINKIEEAQW